MSDRSMSTSTRLLVLGAVRIFQPVHGYDVRRELLSWRVDQWANVAPGSIYNALKSLAKDHYLEVVGTDQVGGRPERTTYRLTADGHQEFLTLLRQAWWMVCPLVDPLMPAVCFLPMMSRDELVAVLRQRVTQIEGLLKQADFAIGELPTPTTPEHVKELYRLSAARLAAEITWATALMARIERGEYGLAGQGRSKGAIRKKSKAAPPAPAKSAPRRGARRLDKP
jgi:DNA-binding PadR family transcriptional regulator